MFTLLHTNDFHNHLTTSQSEILHGLRQALGQHGLLVDAGDAVASGNVTFRPWGETILKTMNHIGYDAMTVGNREFHVSQVGFHSKVKLAQFPILCANVRASSRSGKDEDPGSLPVRSHIVRILYADTGRALKTVIFGLTVPMVTERMMARHASAYIFEQPIAAALKYVPQWKEEYQPDLMIALTHIGYPQDRKLAEAVPGIDLIIGGHSHTRLPNGERVGNTLIVQTGCFGHHVGRIEILRGADSDLTLRADLLDLPKISRDEEVEAQISRFRAALKNDTTNKDAANDVMPGTERTI